MADKSVLRIVKESHMAYQRPTKDLFYVFTDSNGVTVTHQGQRLNITHDEAGRANALAIASALQDFAKAEKIKLFPGVGGRGSKKGWALIEKGGKIQLPVEARKGDVGLSIYDEETGAKVKRVRVTLDVP